MARNGIKALTFDVGGSVFDWQTSTRGAVAALAQSKGDNTRAGDEEKEQKASNDRRS